MSRAISCVKNYKGKPAIFIDDKPYSPLIYALTDKPAGTRTWETVPHRNIEIFSNIGYKLFQVDISFEQLIIGDTLSIDYIKKQLAGILVCNKDAYLMLRLHINPTIFWTETHRDECVKYFDIDTVPNPYNRALDSVTCNDLFNYNRVSFASKVWKDEYLEKVRTVIKEICSSPECDHIFAIQIANGIYGENHYWGGIRYTPDNSECMKKYFREYIKNKYKTVDNLRKAYNDESIDFSSISPIGMERYNLDDGIFKDPNKSKQTIDYYLCQHSLVTNIIIDFAKAIKEESNNTLLCGCFYGYYFSLFGRAASAGHLDEQSILNCENIDFMCAPQAYGKANRVLNGPAISRGLIESALLHNKLWLDEMDQPSHYGCTIGGMLVFNKQDSIYNHRKHILESFIRGGGCWLYDFGPRESSGWWDDPDYIIENKKIKDLTDKIFDNDFVRNSDTLLVYGTKTMFYVSPKPDTDPITDTLMNIFTIEAFKSGASCDTVYLSDIKRVNLDKYKIVIFVNTFYMDDDTYMYVNETVKSKCESVVFFSFPGYVSDRGLSLEKIRNLTEMNIKFKEYKLLPIINYLDSFEYGKDENIENLYIEKKIQNYLSSKLCYIDDDEVLPFAKYDCDDLVCAGKKNNIYFFSIPLTSPEKIRTLLKMCSVHIYRESNNATLEGNGIIELCSCGKEDGVLTLFSKEKIEYSLKENETGIFDEITGEKIL